MKVSGGNLTIMTSHPPRSETRSELQVTFSADEAKFMDEEGNQLEYIRMKPAVMVIDKFGTEHIGFVQNVQEDLITLTDESGQIFMLRIVSIKGQVSTNMYVVSYPGKFYSVLTHTQAVRHTVLGTLIHLKPVQKVVQMLDIGAAAQITIPKGKITLDLTPWSGSGRSYARGVAAMPVAMASPEIDTEASPFVEFEFDNPMDIHSGQSIVIKVNEAELTFKSARYLYNGGAKPKIRSVYTVTKGVLYPGTVEIKYKSLDLPKTSAYHSHIPTGQNLTLVFGVVSEITVTIVSLTHAEVDYYVVKTVSTLTKTVPLDFESFEVPNTTANIEPGTQIRYWHIKNKAWVTLSLPRSSP